MPERARWTNYIPINAYWFALTTRSQVLTALILPLLVQEFVEEQAKGTYVGRIRLWTLMAAVLVQALMGLLSDRSTSRWGRRRPFIVGGTLGDLVVFSLIGLVVGLEGMRGYWALFVLYLISTVSSNAAHAATQGLIPDLVPEEERGRASGVKALLEIPLPLVFVSFVVGRLISGGQIWAALFTVMAVMVLCTLLTLRVREKPLAQTARAWDWQPLLRLLLMTAAFTLIILVIGALVNVMMVAAAEMSNETASGLTVLGGLVGMSVAIGAGVSFSIRLGIGPEARRRPAFTWWVINRLAFLAASVNVGSFMLYFLQERFPHLEEEHAAGPAATAIMFVGIFVLLTAIPSGWLADRLGKKPLIAAGGLLAALGTATALVFPQMAAVYVGGSFIGAAVGLFYSANWALGTEIVPREEAGRYLGISNLAGAGAGAVGAYIGGPIADHSGYVLLFAIYGMLFLVSILALQRVNEKGRRLAATAHG
jgi:MFS family permease